MGACEAGMLKAAVFRPWQGLGSGVNRVREQNSRTCMAPFACVARPDLACLWCALPSRAGLPSVKGQALLAS